MSFVPTAPKRMAALKAGVQEGSRMALYRMNNEAKYHLVMESSLRNPRRTLHAYCSPVPKLIGYRLYAVLIRILGSPKW